MENLPCELAKFEPRVIGFIVIVIARPEVEPVRGEHLALPIGHFQRHMPAGIGLAKVCGYDLVLETDVAANIPLVDYTVQIFENGGTVCYRLFVRPGFEFEPQRMHVAIRSHAGVAEQIPRPAEILALLDYRKTMLWSFFPHMRGHADA